MNVKMISYLLGILMIIEAALLLIPTLIAIIYGESVIPYLITVAILALVALPFIIRKPKNTRIYAKDGFICVAASWIILSLFGALPFTFSGSIPSFADAFFETVSGFTTTGATILTSPESLPHGLLFWRSLTHWVGGMGVLVFMLAIMPSAGGNAIHLLRAEVPGPTKGKIVPKLRQTAMILYGIYMALTFIEVIALLLTGMPLYDSIVNSLATAGTGGFSVKNASIAGYNNPAAEWVIAAFMMIFGINFNIYYFILIGKIRDAFKSEELRVYVFLIIASAAAITINTWNMFTGAGDCIRSAFFQVTSIMSTTGFSTVNYDTWPALSKTILFILTFVGACAGSTAGGLKISRILIIFKNIFKEVKHMIRPNSVNVIKLDGEAVNDSTSKSASNYLGIYFLLIFASLFLVSFDGFDLETNISSVVTCINNVGPGLGKIVGPAGNFSDYSIFSKIILSADMLFGRLEIMPMLIFFTPSAWKNK